MLKYFKRAGKSCITIRDLGSSSEIVLGSSREIFKYFEDGKIWAPCPQHTYTHITTTTTTTGRPLRRILFAATITPAPLPFSCCNTSCIKISLAFHSFFLILFLNLAGLHHRETERQRQRERERESSGSSPFKRERGGIKHSARYHQFIYLYFRMSVFRHRKI